MGETPERMIMEQVQERFDTSPAISNLGLKVVSLDYDQSEIMVEMPFLPHMERRAGTGQYHGGPIAAFIDTVGDFAIGMMVGGPVPTINIRIDYLRPGKGEALTAVARVRNQGRTLAVVDIEVLNGDGKLVAVGRGTYSAQQG